MSYVHSEKKKLQCNNNMERQNDSIIVQMWKIQIREDLKQLLGAVKHWTSKAVPQIPITFRPMWDLPITVSYLSFI